MHQYLLLQQSNRRAPIAHAKNRGEVRGSTRKLYRQKGTGRARRGSIRSPLLRGGGKAFGPRKERNFSVRMPKKMRHTALRSCLSAQAKAGRILGLDGALSLVKTKEACTLLCRLPVSVGRRILFVLPSRNDVFRRAVQNIPGTKAILAAYLNPEDLLSARHILFHIEAIKKAEQLFGKGTAGKRQGNELTSNK